MLIFYYKHYRQSTPFWLHALVLLGIAVKGGREVWSDVLAGRKLLQRPRFGQMVNVEATATAAS